MKEPNRVRKNPIKQVNVLQLDDDQKEAKRLIVENQIVVVTGRAGCLGKGTKVLMYDLTLKNVEDIVVGDKLMGTDSEPRNVLELKRGKEQMYLIKQDEGISYRVNESHILSLIKEETSEIVNIKVSDYLKLPVDVRTKQLKGYINNIIYFKKQDVLINPYYLGLCLGNNNKTLEEVKILYNLNDSFELDEKYIPIEYIKNNIDTRLQLLAGLIDSNAGLLKNSNYEISLKSKKLKDDLVLLCRTLGFKVNSKKEYIRVNNTVNSHYNISIAPTNILIIPTKVNKQSNFKNKKLTNIQVVKDKIDDYYGFTLDGNNLFMLEDFTVTHNSGKSLVAIQAALDFLSQRMCDKIYVTRAAIEVGKSLGYLPGQLEDKFNPYIESIVENAITCTNNPKLIQDYIDNEKLIGTPIQFIRGKTFNDVVIVEECQNMTKHEMLAILTRLGKTGKIIITGDNDQSDIRESYTGLSYMIELSKRIDGIEWKKLQTNHRSDLVGKILDYEYSKNQQ